MFTGASTADVAVVLIDARHGVVTQTRRHVHISALLGIEHMVVCVNKMDLVELGPGRFEEISEQAHELGAPISAFRISGGADQRAARRQRGVTARRRRRSTPGRRCWSISRRSTSRPTATCGVCACPIQWVGRPPDGGPRLYTGRMHRGHAARRRRGRRAPGGRDHHDHRRRRPERRAQRGGAAAVGGVHAGRPARRRARRHARRSRRPAAERARARGARSAG